MYNEHLTKPACQTARAGERRKLRSAHNSRSPGKSNAPRVWELARWHGRGNAREPSHKVTKGGQIFSFLTDEMRYNIFLLKAWFSGGPPLDLVSFEASMAYPFQAFNYVAVVRSRDSR